MPDAGRNGTWEVWVLPPAGDDYSWRTSGWEKAPQLMPERFNRRAGNLGTATFRRLKQRRQDPGFATYRTSGPELWVGMWVLITCGNTATALDWARVRWWGTLSALRDEPDKEGGYLGSTTAAEVGDLLDRTGLSGWRAATGIGTSITVARPTTFNLNGEAGEVIGNRTLDGGGKPVLARSAASCRTNPSIDPGAFWNRRALLTYVLSWLMPPGLPTITENLAGPVVSALGDGSPPEVYDLAPLTVRGALDLCLPRARGLGWRLDLAADGSWRLDGWSLLDSGEGGVPTQTPTPVDLTGDGTIKSVSFVLDEGSWYDEVQVLGAPILVMGSLAASDTAWVNKWESAQLSAWKAGSTEALYGERLRDACARVREGAAIRDVFTRFGIGGSTDSGILRRSALPGTTPESLSLPWFPLFAWDGTNPSASDSGNSDPLWTAARIARTLPWRVGVRGDGTDTRGLAAKAQPTYMEPRVFIYDSALTPAWRDLLLDERKRSGASVECDDRGPDLRIRCSPPEWLAAGDWSGIVAPRIGVQGSAAPPGAYDWRKMLVTVAIASDQRLQVVKRRAGITEAQVRKRLILADEKLQAWYVHPGTVVGLNADGTPDRVFLASPWTRNDWPTAERRARLAAAWALTPRHTAVIACARPDTPPAWAQVGLLLGTITHDGGADAVNTAVEDVAVALGDAPTLTVTTDLPEAPSFGSGGGGGGGGAVSLQLGATVPQAVAALQTEIGAAQRDQSRVPVLAARPALGDYAESTTQVVSQSAHGFSEGQWLRRNGSAWALAQADSAANADVGGMVVSVLDDNAFVLATAGAVRDLSGLTDGTVYYLSATVAGAITATSPASQSSAYLEVPVLLADSATSGILLARQRRDPAPGHWSYAWVSNAGAVTFPSAVPVGGKVRISARLREAGTTGSANNNLWAWFADLDIVLTPTGPTTCGIKVARSNQAWYLQGTTSIGGSVYPFHSKGEDGVNAVSSGNNSVGSLTVWGINTATGALLSHTLTVATTMAGGQLTGVNISGAPAPYLQCLADA